MKRILLYRGLEQSPCITEIPFMHMPKPALQNSTLSPKGDGAHPASFKRREALFRDLKAIRIQGCRL